MGSTHTVQIIRAFFTSLNSKFSTMHHSQGEASGSRTAWQLRFQVTEVTQIGQWASHSWIQILDSDAVFLSADQGISVISAISWILLLRFFRGSQWGPPMNRIHGRCQPHPPRSDAGNCGGTWEHDSDVTVDATNSATSCKNGQWMSVVDGWPMLHDWFLVRLDISGKM